MLSENAYKQAGGNMNKNSMTQIMAVMLTVCFVSVYMMSPISFSSDADSETMISIDLNDLGITEQEMKDVLAELGSSAIYLISDDSGILKAEITEITEKGRLRVDTTYDGLRIYLDSVSVAAIMSGGSAAVGAAIGSLIPVVGTVAGAVIFAIVAGAVTAAITEGLNWSNGIVVNVKLVNHHILFGVDIPLPTTPKIAGVSSQ